MKRTLPSPSSTNALGMVLMPVLATSFCAASRTTVKDAGCSFRNASMSVRSSSTFTPMMTSPRSAYFFCNSFKAGNESLHGPHHEAQKSTSTTLSLSASGSLPSSLNVARSGNGSPVFSPAQTVNVTPTANAVTRENSLIGFILLHRITSKISRRKMILLGDDRALDAGAQAHQIHALARSENEGRGRKDAGERAVRRD